MQKRFLFCLVFLFPFFAKGQDITAFRQGNLFRKSASFSMGYNANTQWRDTLKVNSNAFVASLRGNLEVAGIAFPLHLTYRTGQFSSGFDNPFIRFGISPYYKWIRLHVGHRSMQFSNYSLNGITFLGAGLELNPGIFRLAAMYGNIQTPNYNLDSLAYYANLIRDYKRKAHGVKIGIGKDRRFWDIYYLKVKDNYGDNQEASIYKTLLPPAENLVLGTRINMPFLKYFFFEFNGDLSTVTNNQLSKSDSLQDKRSRDIMEYLSPYLTTNATTRVNLAYDASLRMMQKYFDLGIKFKHIDPNYTSFGMHYIIDDVQNYTVNGGVRLFQQKLSMNGSYGIQVNNLKNVRKNTSTRNIMNLNASIMPATNAGLQLMYSNYSIDQTPGFAVVNDSFRLVQQTAVLSLTPFYRTTGKISRHQLSFNYNQSSITDVSPVEIDNRDGKTGTYAFNWTFDRVVTKWGTSLTFLKADEKFGMRNTGRWGGNASLRKRWEKTGLFFTLSGGYYSLNFNGAADGYSTNLSLQSGISFNKASNLQFTASWLDRASIQAVKYRELRGSVNLIYSFFQKAKDGKK
ncbi:MAG: hypothetical protein U0V54_09215 [Saprospiraceae bacterium]